MRPRSVILHVKQDAYVAVCPDQLNDGDIRFKIVAGKVKDWLIGPLRRQELRGGLREKLLILPVGFVNARTADIRHLGTGWPPHH